MDNRKARDILFRAGFSLAETSLALAVIALVLGAMVPGLLALRAAEQARATRSALESVTRATAAFVQANGCLPCPSPSTSIFLPGFGVVRGDASANPAPCGGTCAAVGLVPFRSLGLPQSAARDGYGRWLTFAVDSTLTQDFGVVPPTSVCREVSPSCTQEDVDNRTIKQGLCQEGLSTANRLEITLQGGAVASVAAFLVVSHGKNGRGAYGDLGAKLRFPASVPACNAGVTGNERCNAGGDRFFADVIPAAGDDPFDDILAYLDRNALVAYGGGPSCQTAW